MIARALTALLGRLEAAWIILAFAATGALAWFRRDAAADALRQADLERAEAAAEIAKRIADAPRALDADDARRRMRETIAALRRR
jgi:hypothetical protein